MNRRKEAEDFLNQFPDLGFRQEGFTKIFEELLNKNKSEYLIIETGTVRKKDNWRGDGQSTRIFDKFVNQYGGIVVSIDNDPVAIDLAKNLVSDKVHFITGDSVRFLDKCPFKQEIDLLYLDSYDSSFHPTNDTDESKIREYYKQNHLSALHVLKELCAVWTSLPDGCLVLTDDNVTQSLLDRFNKNMDSSAKYEYQAKEGKGLYFRDFMENLDRQPFIDEYQLGYIK